MAAGDEIDPDVKHEPKEALYAGADGFGVYRRLARQSPARLNPGGEMILEVGAGQAGAVRAIFDAEGWKHQETCSDLAGIERVLSFLR